jgi:formylmethanofuran dehydrogenase subunit B
MISEGQFDAVLMETNLKDILDGKEIDVINLTDVEKSQYIQYLSHLHDSLISRLFFMLGLGTTDNGKQAQISVDELNKNDDASITQALAWYNERKKAIDKAKEKGHELTFDFSPLWKARIDSIINPPEQQNDMESTTDDEPEKEGEPDGDSDSGDSDE